MGEYRGALRQWLRWYDALGNCPTEAEREHQKELAQQQVEQAQQQVEQAQQQVERERQLRELAEQQKNWQSNEPELAQRLRELGSNPEKYNLLCLAAPIPDIQIVPVRALSAPVALVTRPTRTRRIIDNGARCCDRCCQHYGS